MKRLFGKEGKVVGSYKFLDNDFVGILDRQVLTFYKKDFEELKNLNIGKTLGGEPGDNYMVWSYANDKLVMIELLTNFPNHSIPEYRAGYCWANLVFPDFRGGTLEASNCGNILRYIAWIKLGKPILYTYHIFTDGQRDKNILRTCTEVLPGRDPDMVYTNVFKNYNNTGKDVKIRHQNQEQFLEMMVIKGDISEELYEEVKSITQ